MNTRTEVYDALPRPDGLREQYQETGAENRATGSQKMMVYSLIGGSVCWVGIIAWVVM